MSKSNRQHLILYLLLCAGLIACNTHPVFKGLDQSEKITTTSGDTVWNFTVPGRAQVKKIKFITDRSYTYFYNGKLHTARGGITGKPLNGNFVKNLRSGSILEKGKFEDGLKVGSWLSWNADGNLTSSVYWKDGALNGPFVEYKKNGTPYRSGYYRSGQLHGKILIYTDGSLEPVVEKYRNGVFVPAMAELPENSQPNQKRRRRIFKREQQTDVQQTGRDSLGKPALIATPEGDPKAKTGIFKRDNQQTEEQLFKQDSLENTPKKINKRRKSKEVDNSKSVFPEGNKESR